MQIQVLQTALLKHLQDLNKSRKEMLAMHECGNLSPFLQTITNTELVDQIQTTQALITEIERLVPTVNPIKTLFSWTNNKSLQGSKKP